MAQVIAFSIFKGGTGKTTSSVNTAAALSERGKRVLLIDLDQQASATKYLGIDPDNISIPQHHSYNAKHTVATSLATHILWL